MCQKNIGGMFSDIFQPESYSRYVRNIFIGKVRNHGSNDITKSAVYISVDEIA